MRNLLLPEIVKGRMENKILGRIMTGGDSKKVNNAQEIQAEVEKIDKYPSNKVSE